jgi:ferric enterobactin receptor
LTAEVFGNYNSTRINAQGTYPAFFTYNFAVREDLFNGKGSIALTATNPFNYYVNQTTNLTGENFTVVTTRELPYQSFGFNFAYKFGKLEFKKEKEKEGDSGSEEN